MDLIILLPLIIPFATAITGILLGRRTFLLRPLTIVSTVAQLGAAILLLITVYNNGPIAFSVGGWQAPFGIALVADLLSAIMVVVVGLMGFSVALFALPDIDAQRESYGYHPLYNILLMGVTGAFITGDLFNLYVWFEVLLISSFVLVSLGGEELQLEGALKYVIINLLSSAVFLTSIGFLYHLAGTVNMADLAQNLPYDEYPGLITVMAMLFVITFGVKAAVFPLFFWLPDSYPTPPIAITTIFSALLTKVGVYAILRIFTLLFMHDLPFIQPLILTIAALTMITGVFGAVSQYEFRRLLSFHIISQIGYLLMGIGLFSPLGLAGTIFFMVHVIIAKSALFLVSGIVNRMRGTYDLHKLGGLYTSNVGIAILFLLPALSLGGIPPLSGFWAKFALIQAGLEGEQYLVTAAALGVSILTLYSMTKIWTYAFWKKHPNPENPPADRLPASQRVWYLAPLVILVILTVGLGIFAEPLLSLSMEAAEQLLNPAAYIQASIGR